MLNQCKNNPKPGNYWVAAEQVPPDWTAAAQLRGAGVGNGADALVQKVQP